MRLITNVSSSTAWLTPTWGTESAPHHLTYGNSQKGPGMAAPLKAIKNEVKKSNEISKKRLLPFYRYVAVNHQQEYNKISQIQPNKKTCREVPNKCGYNSRYSWGSIGHHYMLLTVYRIQCPSQPCSSGCCSPLGLW